MKLNLARLQDGSQLRPTPLRGTLQPHRSSSHASHNSRTFTSSQSRSCKPKLVSLNKYGRTYKKNILRASRHRYMVEAMGFFSAPSALAVLGLLLTWALAARAQSCAATCPKDSSCSSYKGAPVCVCPRGQHLVGGVCTALARDHSDWLDWMNNARAAVGSPELLWNDSLASIAQSYAQTLGSTRGCPLVHSTPPGVGQNLAGGPRRYARNIANSSIVLEWVKEGNGYQYHVFDTKTAGCAQGVWTKCGHYLQIIWSTTLSVGCGLAPCKSGAKTSRVWVCDYWPGGNVVGQYPYQQDPCKATVCPTGATCSSSSGSAVCSCPAGQVPVSGRCAHDPCAGAKPCAGNLICNGTSGVPLCVCPTGTVPKSTGSTVCVPPACVGVVCPGTSFCAAQEGIPFCTCPSGTVFQGSTCTNSPASPVILTALALYSSNNNILALRFRGLSQCINLESFRISLYSVLWRANATQGATIPGNVASAPCGKVLFWSGASCRGHGSGWPVTEGDIVKMAASGIITTAQSVKCS